MFLGGLSINFFKSMANLVNRRFETIQDKFFQGLHICMLRILFTGQFYFFLFFYVIRFHTVEYKNGLSSILDKFSSYMIKDIMFTGTSRVQIYLLIRMVALS